MSGARFTGHIPDTNTNFSKPPNLAGMKVHSQTRPGIKIKNKKKDNFIVLLYRFTFIQLSVTIVSPGYKLGPILSLCISFSKAFQQDTHYHIGSVVMFAFISSSKQEIIRHQPPYSHPIPRLSQGLTSERERKTEQTDRKKEKQIQLLIPANFSDSQ